MKPPINHLLRLKDDRLFEEAAGGIRLVVEHAESLESTAVRLRTIDEHRAAAIVSALAKEESAKVLILVDLDLFSTNLGEAGLATVPSGGHLSGDYRSTTFERQPESGWAHWHQHSRRIISHAYVGYVCGLGQHWMAGLERWEGPPQLPPRLTIGVDTR